MATANDLAWEQYLNLRGLPLDGTSHHVLADDLRQVTGREPRLLAKFDTPEELPRCLREAGYALLPVRHGEYLLCRDDPFCVLPDDVRPVDESSELPFALDTAARGQGEPPYIDHAFNTRLLHRFTGCRELFLTVRGRERCGQFSFSFGGETVEVDGVQIEIDAGYEGERDLILIEAKIGQPRHLNVRQLYYPWRHYRMVTRKTVRPVVLSYDVATTRYAFAELTFATTEDPTTWQILHHAVYRLHDAENRRLDDLLDPAWQTRVDLVPQADDLNKLVAVLELIDSGQVTSRELADAMVFDERQARYYREAAVYLGLLEESGRQPTANGRWLLRASPRQRRLGLAKAVVNSWIVRDLARRHERIDRATIAAAISSLSDGQGGQRFAQVTASRRAKTIEAWLRWLAAEVGCFRADGDGYRVS